MDLLTFEQISVARCGKLYRPTLVRAKAKRAAPPGEAKVVGVEVRRRERDRGYGLRVDAVQDSLEVRQVKGTGCPELQLTLEGQLFSPAARSIAFPRSC